MPPGKGDWALRIKAVSETQAKITKVPLYETFETALTFPVITENRFAKFVSFTFTKNRRSFNVDGFYNGNDKWCVRFMPDETGVWKYEWTFEGRKGKGKFLCIERKNPKNHGHVKRDPVNPRYLIHDAKRSRPTRRRSKPFRKPPILRKL